MPHLCVFGCKYNPDIPVHVFPSLTKYPDRFKAWVNLVGNHSQQDYEFYRTKRVCDIHFTNGQKNRNRRLNALAIPCLHLPESQLIRQQEESLATCPVSVSAESRSTEAEVKRDVVLAKPVSGASQDVQHSSITVLPAATSAAFETVIEKEHNYSLLSRLRHKNRKDESQNVQHSTITAPAATSAALETDIEKEHNYSLLSRLRHKNRKGFQHRKPQYKYVETREMKHLRNEICRLRIRGKSFKERLRNSQKLSDYNAFQRVVKNATKPAQLFMHMQLQTVKKSKGRRYTLEEKILSLSLYKKSPKCYRLLCNLFALPSTRAMKRLLSQIKISPGINLVIFEKIKKLMAEKHLSDRLCSLIFDEVSLTPQIFYNAQKDELQGFASNKPNAFANHALVFMVKGVKNTFKQPIAYYFTNSLNKFELVNLIKTVAKHALKSGLIIVNTVCDQSTVNVGAITQLVQETKALYLRQGKEWKQNDHFTIVGHTIIPIYDVPHLIKGLRNNLLTKDMVYITEKGLKKVKWEFFQMVYEADKSYGELRLLDKITEEHINPEKIPKMRVKFATQVFSHSMAVVAEHLTARGDLPEECRQLIEITLLFDNLFDSLNGSTLTDAPNGKIYKGPVRRKSCHHELWLNAKKILKTVKYIKKDKVGDKVRFTETTVPTLNNLVKTIEGMEYLWRVLSGKYGLDAILTRNFNQDPVENFFGNIRSYGARNVSPNTVSFEGAYKALMLNNYSTPHSSRANCEEDSNECLKTYEFFLKERVVIPDAPKEDIIEFNEEICIDQPTETDAGQKNYVCGWVVKKCLKNVVKGCQSCKTNLLDYNSSNPRNIFIKAKNYQKKRWLCEPNEHTEKSFAELQNITISVLKKNVLKKGLKGKITMIADVLLEFPFTCSIHKDNLKQYFINITVNVLVYSWCRSVNRILAGHLKYSSDDETKLAAQKYYNKYKNYRNKK